MQVLLLGTNPEKSRQQITQQKQRHKQDQPSQIIAYHQKTTGSNAGQQRIQSNQQFFHHQICSFLIFLIKYIHMINMAII